MNKNTSKSYYYHGMGTTSPMCTDVFISIEVYYTLDFMFWAYFDLLNIYLQNLVFHLQILVYHHLY